MTIDERLEFLFKSTESLHSTLEAHIAEQASFKREVREFYAEMATYWREQRETNRHLAAMIKGLNSLVRNHDKRLDVIDGGEPDPAQEE